MSSYQALAAAYDALTQDVGYERRTDFLEKLFRRSRIPVTTVLDLACGTGSVTALLTARGYEMIAVDASPEMLMQAREKMQGIDGIPPLFLCQSMPKLDLYGTVDAAVCCLDSFNYLTDPRDLRRTLARLRLFIAPGGVLIFDVHAPEHLQSLDGQVFLDETDDFYCIWRGIYHPRSQILDYRLDLFRLLANGTWQRETEEHRERAYSAQQLRTWLEEAGFTDIRIYGDCRMRAPRPAERMYFCCRRA